MNYALLVTSSAGFLLSLYTFYVESRMGKGDYKPACDISDRLSCTRAFMSSYGRLFGISNAVSGMGLYALMFLLAFYGMMNFAFYLASLSLLLTFYLAYALHFKVKSVCIVCYSVYAVNMLLFAFSYLDYKSI